MKQENTKHRFSKQRLVDSNIQMYTPHRDRTWCENPCLQSVYEVCLGACQATSLIHFAVFDCGRGETVVESRDDCCRWGHIGSCLSFENDWAAASPREALPTPDNRFDLRTVPSTVSSSSSSFRRKRPLAIAVGSNHLADADGRLVVVTPTRKGKTLAGSPQRNVLQSLSFGSSSGMHQSILKSLSYPSETLDSSQVKWKDVFRQRLGMGRAEEHEGRIV